MTFARKSLFTVSSLVLAGLLATTGVGVMAQSPTNPQGDAGTTSPTPQASPQANPRGERMGRHDPAKMQAHTAKLQADMKAKLKITPAQEGAWTAFTASMQPPANMMGTRPGPEQRAEFDTLTTPQRIDKMREMRTQRMAAMDKRMDATKTFYAALSPEQQKVFDTEHSKRGGRHGGGHHGGMSGMGSMEHRKG